MENLRKYFELLQLQKNIYWNTNISWITHNPSYVTLFVDHHKNDIEPLLVLFQAGRPLSV